MSSSLFNLGPLVVQVQGLLAACGVVAGLLLVYMQSGKAGQRGFEIALSIVLSLLIGFVFGRIFWVVVNYEELSQKPFYEFFFMRGGMDVYAAVAAAFGSFWFFSKWYSFGFFQVLDLLVGGALLALGVFFVGAYVTDSMIGRSTALPWAVKKIAETGKSKQALGFHPIALYYTVLIAAISGYLVLARKEIFFKGQRFWRFALFFLGGVFFLEFFNQASEKFVIAIGFVGLSMRQLVCFCLFVIAATLYYFIRKKAYERL